MDRFKDKYGHLVTKTKIREILSNYYFDDIVFSFEKIDSGYENINIIIKIGVKKFVPRIYNDKQYGRVKRDEKHLLYELNFLNYLSENNIPVARINKTIDGALFSKTQLGDHNLFVILFDFIYGKEINKFNKEKIEDMAKWMARIHKLTFDYKPNYIREKDGSLNYYNWWQDSEMKKQRVKDKDISNAYLPIINYYQQYINPDTVKRFPILQIHTDLHQGNLCFINNKLSGIFDFDDTRHSIIPEDLGMFFHVLFKKGHRKACKRKVDTFFQSYEKVRNLTRQEKQMALCYALEKRYQGRYFEAYHDEKDGKLTKELKQYYLDYTKRFKLLNSLIKEYS